MLHTIESAVAQTYEDKEIILVDDGSTDGSVRIAERFLAARVKLFRQSKSGSCSARNRAFAESTGAYIQYLDADDLLPPDKIKNQMAIAPSDDGRKVLSGSFVRFYDGQDATTLPVVKSFIDRDWSNPLDWLFHAWSGRGMGQTSIWLTPRPVIEKAGPWNEKLSVNQDGEFFCRVLLSSSGIKYSPDSHVYYRSGNVGSVSQMRNRQQAEHLLLSYELYETHVLKHEDSTRIRMALSRNYRTFVYQYYDEYKDLVLRAMNNVDALKLRSLPLTGGSRFKTLAQAVGFGNALRLRSIQRKIAGIWR